MMKSRENIGVFCENNTEHTRVHILLGEKQSYFMLQQLEHVVATGLHSVTPGPTCCNLFFIFMDSTAVMYAL